MDEMHKKNEKVCQTTHHPSITSFLVGLVGGCWFTVALNNNLVHREKQNEFLA
jgi:hypothetical protein